MQVGTGTYVYFYYEGHEQPYRHGTVHTVKPNKKGETVITIRDETEGGAYRSFKQEKVKNLRTSP